MRIKQNKPKRANRRNVSHQRFNYAPEALIKAYEAVRGQTMSVTKAARQFGVPETTLRDRTSGRINAYTVVVGGEPLLTKEEEEVIVDHMETLALLGYGYTNGKLQSVAGELAHHFGRKEKPTPMSNRWLYRFLSRWNSRIASLSPRGLDSNRARCSTPEAVDTYFNNLNDTVIKYNLLEKPQFIYNLDETGLQPDHKVRNVIASVQHKAQSVTSPKSTTTTLIACVNALGNYIPPFFVFKGKRMNSELMTGATPGAGYEMSESGWSNTDIFRKYLEDHFLPFVRPGDSTQPILLIVDGHASHTSPTLLKWAKSKNLVLFILPAHTSHLLQPLDVTLFGPFKVFYYAECAAYMKEHIGQVITRYEICRLACRAYLRSMTPLNIQAGFRKTGIFPFCKTAVPQEKLFPAEAFREKDPVAKIKAMKSGKEAVEEFLSNKSKEENIRFCEPKEKLCHKCSCGAKIPKPKPGGRAVTEDNYLQEVDRYESSRDRAGKENADSPMKKI